ncbi:MAG: hypothetical protein MUD10_02395 [Candidatus Pacebacteria bacterium]|jgi:hypothetical protein|nr:hypothetical protein [Candidatus Paceibacterota bacterium]
MCFKNKMIAAALCALVAGIGIFGIGNNLASATTTGAASAGYTLLSVEQLQKIVESLIQQIQQLKLMIAELKPLETCGNGICRFGETAATCAADCGNIAACVKEGETFIDGSKKCCEGLTRTSVPVTCLPSNGSGGCGTVTTFACKKSTVACVKEGEKTAAYPSATGCCVGLGAISVQNIMDNGACGMPASGGICAACGNGVCGLGENKCNCPADCKSNSDDGKNQCAVTGGTWKYLECMSGCGTPATKADRLKLAGMGCAAVCVKGNGCACPTGKAWASREEGCITHVPAIGCLSEGNIKEGNEIGCCTGLAEINYCNDSGECKNASICTAKCGNGACDYRENKYNCPKDCSGAACAKESEVINIGDTKKCCDGLITYSPCTSEQDCIADSWTCKRPANTCVAEGKNVVAYPGSPTCCSGLSAISIQTVSSAGTCSAPASGAVCAKCGNGICGNGENKCNCPKDCSTTITCGDGKCDSGESASCPRDCGAAVSCATICKEKGYDANRCSAWSVSQYIDPNMGCKSNELNLGWTSDCTALGMGGGGRACCCSTSNICPNYSVPNCPNGSIITKNDSNGCAMPYCSVNACSSALTGDACKLAGGQYVCITNNCGSTTSGGGWTGNTAGGGTAVSNCGTGATSCYCQCSATPPIVGGGCAYKNFAGKCAIRTVVSSSAPGYTITYQFTPSVTPDISGTFLESTAKINPYQGSTNSSTKFTAGSTVACTLNVIKAGSCTPITITLPASAGGSGGGGVSVSSLTSSLAQIIEQLKTLLGK